MWPRKKKDMAKENGAADDIGSILMRFGVTLEQVKEAICKQERTGQRLGELLVEAGAISKRILQEALAEQKLIRGQATRKEITDFRRMVRERLHNEATTAMTDAHVLSQTLVKS